MTLKILTTITGNLVTCLRRSTRNCKPVASFTLTVPGTPLARFYSQPLSHNEVKVPVENLNLVTSLEEMGVDLTAFRKIDAILLKKATTHEKTLKQFLLHKGADAKMVASIISRYPRAITRQYEVLDEMWNIWKEILGTDETVLSVAQRSPESFFRTSNTENLLKNICYFQSLGLPSRILSQLMLRAPRTFANSIDLNKQHVKHLLGLCSQLGGKNPREFLREVLSKNIFILTKSVSRVQSNIECMKTLMNLDDHALLLWIQDNGAPILNLSYTYFESNFKGVHSVLESLGCTEAEISLFIFTYPKVLLMTPKVFETKVNSLLECGGGVKEILNNPNLLVMQIKTLKSKIKMLTECGYDFQSSGLSVLLLSQAKLTSKVERLHNSESLN
ncbi:hypothetical protein GDO78_003109 [Eleutherodactylus coqui]|uniref:Mitochondrial transcription termination factor 1 n=1 Tax=Eleutherodactylus coqui TaxID=57060 RepID=A0A8J6EWC3_ELECQ|nr:hypothetical protein GDO78_003109 [Eleutherodactylus coqui]